MIVINGRNSSIALGTILFKIYNIGICVPKMTNVPFEMVMINFVDLTLSESQKISNVVETAHNKKTVYE